VDTALERADHKAQSEALGHALRRGDVQPLGTGRAMNLTGFEVAVWRVRGVAWVLDAAVCWGVGFVGECDWVGGC
jgi:hypothetical protein